jgi:GAF domain-containing protein
MEADQDFTPTPVAVDHLAAVMKIASEAARRFTGSDGATFVLRDGDNCYYAEENAIAPLWKGRRFPATACVSGWVMMVGKSVVIEDIADDPRIPLGVYRQTFVRSLAMVPVRDDVPVAAIGVYWATTHRATEAELKSLQMVAKLVSAVVRTAGPTAEKLVAT